jgi:hypothetical protein
LLVAGGIAGVELVFAGGVGELSREAALPDDVDDAAAGRKSLVEAVLSPMPETDA